MSEAEEWDSKFDAGDDETFAINVDQDITGWTFNFELKRDGTSVISKAITSHDDPTNGKTSFTLTDSETKDLSGIYSYKLTYITDAGNDETVLKGEMNFV